MACRRRDWDDVDDPRCVRAQPGERLAAGSPLQDGEKGVPLCGAEVPACRGGDHDNRQAQVEGVERRVKIGDHVTGNHLRRVLAG
jgi:hypothetical protein